MFYEQKVWIMWEVKHSIAGGHNGNKNKKEKE